MDSHDIYLHQPRVDILVVVFNHETTIIKCLESILNQSYDNLHLNIIDDCSTDNSWTLIKEIESKFPDKIIAKKTPFNVGPVKLIEYCEFYPSGNFWGAIDGDDWWIAEDKISLQVKELLSNPQLIGTSGTTVVLDSSQKIANRINSNLSLWNYLDYLLGVDSIYVHGSSILWRNVSTIKGEFFPRLLKSGWPYGEWPLTLANLSESGKSMSHIKKDFSVYNASGSGIWSSLSDSAMLDASKKIELQIWTTTPFWQKFLALIAKGGWRSLSNYLLLTISSFINFSHFIRKELKAVSISRKS